MIHLFPVVRTKAATPFRKSFLGAKGKKTVSVLFRYYAKVRNWQLR